MSTPASADDDAAPPLAARPGAESALLARDRVYIALLLAGFLALAWQLWFVCDDAYISFRYARNLAEGHGLRFNLGTEEPVEGYSNLLWVLLAALVRWLGLDLVAWMPRLSCACGAVLVPWLYTVLRRRFECASESAALATGAVALFPPFAAWASGGLETMPFALALFATFERLILRPGGPDWRGGALAGSALLLVRSEGFAWCAVLGVLAALTAWRAGADWRRPLLRWTIVVGLVFAAVLLHRRLHFQRWIANTTQAKVIVDPDQLSAGRDYLVIYALTFLAPFVLAAAALWTLLSARSQPHTPAVVAMSFAFPAFALVVGGDFMCMGRLLVPGLALQAIPLGTSLRDLAGGSVGRRIASAVAGLAVIGLGLLPVGALLGLGRDVQLVPPEWLEPFHFRRNAEVMRTEREQWKMQKEHAQELVRQGHVLARNTQPGESLVTGAIGAIGYTCDLVIYDRYGLVTRDVAERAVRDDRKVSPGHDRKVGREAFVERNPTYLDYRLVPATRMEEMRETLELWGRKRFANYAPARIDLPDEGSGVEVLLFYRRMNAGEDVEAWRRVEQELLQR